MTNQSNHNGPGHSRGTIMLDQVVQDRRRRAATTARAAGPLTLTIAADVAGQIRPASTNRQPPPTTHSVAAWAARLASAAARLKS